jgi:hypothetical protein
MQITSRAEGSALSLMGTSHHFAAMRTSLLRSVTCAQSQILASSRMLDSRFFRRIS